MAVIKDYVQYDVTLPSRGLLASTVVAGWLVIAAGLVSLGWRFMLTLSYPMRDAFGVIQHPTRPSVCDDYRLDPKLYPRCQPIEPDPMFSVTWLYDHWYLGLIVLAVGIVLTCVLQSKYSYFYRNVRQGKILKRDTNGGGNAPLGYVILVEGYTHANKLTTQWLSVNAGYWHEVRPGDWVDFRK